MTETVQAIIVTIKLFTQVLEIIFPVFLYKATKIKLASKVVGIIIGMQTPKLKKLPNKMLKSRRYTVKYKICTPKVITTDVNCPLNPSLILFWRTVWFNKLYMIKIKKFIGKQSRMNIILVSDGSIAKQFKPIDKQMIIYKIIVKITPNSSWLMKLFLFLNDPIKMSFKGMSAFFPILQSKIKIANI